MVSFLQELRLESAEVDDYIIIMMSHWTVQVGKVRVTQLKERKKERLRQQGNPCLRELRKKFTSGASTRQTSRSSTIKLGRRSLVGVGGF